MGGVVSVLLCMLVQNRFSVIKTASELVFFPPKPPFYSLEPKDSEEFMFDIKIGNPILFGSNQAQLDHFHHAENDMKPEVTMVDTKRKKKIPVLCYRCPGAKYTVLYSHGNATDVGAMHDRFVQLVTALNVNVVAYDYTGYGASTGDVPTEKDTYCDIEAAYQWTLKNCPGNGVNEADGTTSGENIVLYGQSLGSGPTCYLACKERVAGVVLHSPILSAMRVITDSRILAFIDMYPNIERIGKVTSPVVVIHGMLDAEVNWEHGRRLHELTPSIYRRNPWWVSDRGHNDLINDAEHLEEYIWHMKMFLADLDIKSE